jgi:membrane protein
LFGIYVENFAQYNELYGSIGAILILMLYIWLNSNIILLGYELNASLLSLKKKVPNKSNFNK